MNDRIKEDFNRDVYCLLGLPIDNMTIESTKEYLRSRSDSDSPAVWSTVNVNWVVQSFRDKEFRKAIINSDLVTLDGKPLLWLSKLLGYPMTEVVPGSSMIQKIHEDTGAKKKLSIFFFGGDGDVGSLAMEKVNSKPSGLRAVGAINPGFGTVEEMSSNAIIETINRAKPDILLVALGAKKGTAWIEYNRDKLNAKVVSHLGATINFLAGTVRRAPRLFQKTAMEWVWRILQEPKLFLRYAYDGLFLTGIVMRRIVIWREFCLQRRGLAMEKQQVEFLHSDNGSTIEFSFKGNSSLTRLFSDPRFLSRCIRMKKNIIYDFSGVNFIDGSVGGLLLLVEKQLMKRQRKLVYMNVNVKLKNMFNFFRFNITTVTNAK